jgi:hypothetical protein
MDPVKNIQSVSLHNLATGRHWLGVQFITRLNSNTCIALTTDNTMESNYFVARSALGQWNTSVTGHIAARVFSPQHKTCQG